MLKRRRIEVAEFIDGEYVFPSDRKRFSSRRQAASIGLTTIATAPLAPIITFADDGGTFERIFPILLRMVDAGVVFVIIFAGATWMLGNRGKSLELLLGAGAGYLIVRNAINIRDGLKALAPSVGGI